MKYTKEQLISIITENKDETVVVKSFELGKDKFDIIDLRWICENCKHNSLVQKIKSEYLKDFDPTNITLQDLTDEVEK
jgi:hypothetical protein